MTSNTESPLESLIMKQAMHCLHKGNRGRRGVKPHRDRSLANRVCNNLAGLLNPRGLALSLIRHFLKINK